MPNVLRPLQQATIPPVDQASVDQASVDQAGRSTTLADSPSGPPSLSNGPVPAAPRPAEPSTNPSASLLVIADHLERYEEQVGGYLPSYVDDDHGDVAAALVEAERALRTAARLLRRAARLTAPPR